MTYDNWQDYYDELAEDAAWGRRSRVASEAEDLARENNEERWAS